jgi:hypothetical protein
MWCLLVVGQVTETARSGKSCFFSRPERSPNGGALSQGMAKPGDSWPSSWDICLSTTCWGMQRWSQSQVWR